MPSPIAHSVVGLTLGSAWFLPHGRPREWLAQARTHWRGLLGCVLLSNAPDIDYLFGIPAGNFNTYHQYGTHTFGFVLAVVLVSWWFWNRYEPGKARAHLLLLATIGFSHLLLDLVTGDTGAPYGIMALWPFTPQRIYWPDAAIFMDLNKGSILSLHNLNAGLRELLFTLPALAWILVWKSLPFGRPGSTTTRVK
jgi:membrane-bound metal-dependent hydrolase YbcI (DUF457 family)